MTNSAQGAHTTMSDEDSRLTVSGRGNRAAYRDYYENAVFHVAPPAALPPVHRPDLVRCPACDRPSLAPCITACPDCGHDFAAATREQARRRDARRGVVLSLLAAIAITGGNLFVDAPEFLAHAMRLATTALWIVIMIGWVTYYLRFERDG